MWTIFFGLGFIASGLWIFRTPRAIGIGAEGGEAWFTIDGKLKRLVGVLVVIGGAALLLSGIFGDAVLG